MARVRYQNERRALLQAKRVPWQALAAAAEEYTDWQTFTLWLRAVVDAARYVPVDTARELESRDPRVAEHIHGDVEAAANNPGKTGTKIWQAVGGGPR